MYLKSMKSNHSYQPLKEDALQTEYDQSSNYEQYSTDKLLNNRRSKKQDTSPLHTMDKHCCNECSANCSHWKKLFCQYIGAEWLFLLLLGIIMALLSFGMDYTIQKCQKAHYWLYTELENFVALQYLAWVLFPLVFITFSVGFVYLVSPQAEGSGIPEMKTIMRGVILPEYLTFRVLMAKMIGLTSALGSRLPIGKEGPFVHIASVCATLLNKFLKGFSSIHENETRHFEMLAAACAVGVACNFAAPIGGVLFSIEVTATYFAVSNYWRGFFSAVCGALAFRLLAVWNKEEETITALFKTNFRVEFPFDLQELSAFSVIGIVSGFAGALFVYVHRCIVNVQNNNARFKSLMSKNRFIYPTIVSLVISSLTYPRGIGQFMAGELTLTEALDALFDNKTWAKLGYIDESEFIPDVQQGWKHPVVNIYVTLVLFIVLHFFMTAVAITLAVPSGVFMPVFLIGAAFGRLVGECVAALYPDGFYSGATVFRIVPGGYAVVGAASLAGAVTHTISTSVIVFELTGQISHILPVMIAVLIANAIAQSLQPSIYDSIIQIKGLPYLPDLVGGKKKFFNTYARDFMVKKFDYVSSLSTYTNVEALLKRTDADAFPLVDTPGAMMLSGSVQRSALLRLLAKKDSRLISKSEIKTEPQSNVRESRHSVDADLQDIIELETCAKHESEPERVSGNDFIHLANCRIDPAPYQLVEQACLYKVHHVFSMLGLHSAFVTSSGRLVGVVSLKELRSAIAGATKPSDEQTRFFYNSNSQEMTMLQSHDEVDCSDDEV